MQLTQKKAALYTLVASLAVSGLLGIGALVVGSFGSLEAKVLLTSLTISAGSILALACGAAIERNQVLVLARIGFATATLGTVLILFLVWLEIDSTTYVRIMLSVIAVSTALSLLSLLSFAQLDGRFSWLPLATMIAAAALTALLLYAIWFDIRGDLLPRLIGIASIVMTVLTISTPILHFVSRIESGGHLAMSGAGAVQPGTLPEVINLAGKLGQIDEFWSPHSVAELNGQSVKLAKVKGSFDFHHHENEDELFLVLKGRLSIEFEGGTVHLDEGEAIVVPRGVVHRPIADEEAHILLFEPTGTLNTGNLENERTIRDVPRL